MAVPSPRAARGLAAPFRFEATVLALLLAEGALLYAAFDPPFDEAAYHRAELEWLAQSALDAWAVQDPYSDEGLYTTRLQQFVAEALGGNPSNLVDTMLLALPQGPAFIVTYALHTGAREHLLWGPDARYVADVVIATHRLDAAQFLPEHAGEPSEACCWLFAYVWFDPRDLTEAVFAALEARESDWTFLAAGI